MLQVVKRDTVGPPAQPYEYQVMMVAKPLDLQFEFMLAVKMHQRTNAPNGLFAATLDGAVLNHVMLAQPAWKDVLPDIDEKPEP